MRGFGGWAALIIGLLLLVGFVGAFVTLKAKEKYEEDPERRKGCLTAIGWHLLANSALNVPSGAFSNVPSVTDSNVPLQMWLL